MRDIATRRSASADVPRGHPPEFECSGAGCCTTGSCAAKSRRTCSSSVSTTARPYESSSVGSRSRTQPVTTFKSRAPVGSMAIHDLPLRVGHSLGEVRARSDEAQDEGGHAADSTAAHFIRRLSNAAGRDPICSPPAGQTEGTVPVQNGGSACVLFSPPSSLSVIPESEYGRSGRPHRPAPSRPGLRQPFAPASAFPGTGLPGSGPLDDPGLVSICGPGSRSRHRRHPDRPGRSSHRSPSAVGPTISLAVRMTDPSGMHLRTEAPAPWQSGRPCPRHDRTFIPRWVLHRHAVEPMVHWL